MGPRRWRSGSSINALVVSPDGAYAASGSDDRRVHLWEVRTGREVHTLFGHRGYVGSLAFSPDGKRLASGGRDHTVRLWDVATGKQLRRLRGHEGEVSCVAFTTDGKTLVSVGYDAIRRWDAATGELLDSFSLPPGYVRILDLAPDGRRLVIGGPHVEDNPADLALIDTATGKTVHSFGKEDGPSLSARFGEGRPDAGGRTAGRSGRRMGRRRRAATPFFSAERVDDFRFHFASSPDGKTLVTQKQGEYVQLRDAATGAELHALGWHKDGAVSAFTPDGRTLLTGDGVGRIRTWDAHTGEPIPSDAARWRSLISLAWSPDSRTPLSGCKGGMVRLWDASSGKEVRGFEQPDYSPWTPVAFSPDGNLAATAGHISIRIWEVKTGRLLYEHQDMNMINASVLMFAPDGRTLFIASHRAGFHRWDFASGKKCAPLGDAALSWSAALSPDGKTLLSSNGHGAVCLWEAAGGQCTTSFGKPRGRGVRRGFLPRRPRHRLGRQRPNHSAMGRHNRQGKPPLDCHIWAVLVLLC